MGLPPGPGTRGDTPFWSVYETGVAGGWEPGRRPRRWGCSLSGEINLWLFLIHRYKVKTARLSRGDTMNRWVLKAIARCRRALAWWGVLEHSYGDEYVRQRYTPLGGVSKDKEADE